MALFAVFILVTLGLLAASLAVMVTLALAALMVISVPLVVLAGLTMGLVERHHRAHLH
jgi:hypothetical protein